MENKNSKPCWCSILAVSDMLRGLLVQLNNAALNDFSVAQSRVIRIIYNYRSRGVRVKDISDELDVTPGAVSQILESLDKLEMIERRRDAKDGRALALVPSEKAKKLHRKLEVVATDICTELLDGVSENDIDVFLKVLSSMEEKLVQKKHKITPSMVS